jgi:hypothetical protein
MSGKDESIVLCTPMCSQPKSLFATFVTGENNDRGAQIEICTDKGRLIKVSEFFEVYMWEVFKSFIGKLAKSKWNAQSTKVLRKN